jgi:hypothetical protein
VNLVVETIAVDARAAATGTLYGNKGSTRGRNAEKEERKKGEETSAKKEEAYGRVSALDHEVGDDAVKHGSCRCTKRSTTRLQRGKGRGNKGIRHTRVVPLRTQRPEVLTRLRSVLVVEFDTDLA